jgi:hypothetical protein
MWPAVAVLTTGWKSVPFFNVILNPSFSILKTERSFFLINAMSSLISFKSKGGGSFANDARMLRAAFSDGQPLSPGSLGGKAQVFNDLRTPLLPEACPIRSCADGSGPNAFELDIYEPGSNLDLAMNRQSLNLAAAFAAGLFFGAAIVWLGTPQRARTPLVISERDPIRVKDQPERLRSSIDEGAARSGGDFREEDNSLIEARQLVAETFQSIPEIKTDEHQAAVLSLIYRLRGLGSAGMQATREFLTSGDDVALTEYRVSTLSHRLGLSTLRKALIHSLADWPDVPAATALSREVLSATPNVEEAVLAIHALEKHAPGVYREEALQALRDLTATQPLAATRDAQELIEMVSHYQATEFAPQLERVLNQWPSLVNDYFGAVAAWPEADRQAAVVRVLANPKVLSEIAANPHVLTQLDLTDPAMRSHIVQIFATQLTPAKRERYLDHFGENASFIWGFGLLGSHVGGKDRAQLRVEQSAKLQMLEGLAPYATTPVLQQRLAEAREQLLNQLQPATN